MSKRTTSKRRFRGVLQIVVLLVTGIILLTACESGGRPPPDGGEGRFTYLVDGAIKPSQPALPGLDGGPPRPVAVVAGPAGKRDEFVVNEVVFRPESQEELEAFLAKYGGTVLRDGAPLALPETESDQKAPPPKPSGGYLIRVDLSRSSLNDLSSNMAARGVKGRFSFSSEGAARLSALLAREAELGVSANILFYGNDINEHPDGKGGFLNAEDWWWMTEDDDAATPGNQGLSVGVIHAWRWLELHGVPPPEGVWFPPQVAVIGGGFAFGTTPRAETEYFPTPRQLDVVDHDRTAIGKNLITCGGAPCPWHGAQVLGVAAARHFNQYGGAGTSGNIAWPMAVRVDGTAYSIADGIRSAVLSGADVINVSLGGGCSVASWLCGFPPDDIYSVMKSAVFLADSWGAIVVAAAGNGGINLSGDDEIPCETPTVICVGAVNADGRAASYSNYGSSVDIWAPTGIYSTVIPSRAAKTGEGAVCCFNGTSASAPFVAGIVVLMKALDPDLNWEKARAVLRETANSSPDAKVAPGYVDAFRAVEALRSNHAPEIQITFPDDGAVVNLNRPQGIVAEVSDLEEGDECCTVTWTSSLAGELGTTTGDFHNIVPIFKILGRHTITATATDGDGGSASDSITLNVVNSPPVVVIQAPLPGDEVIQGQAVTFRGSRSDINDFGEPCEALTWTSSVATDPFPLTGCDFQAAFGSTGARTITASATDSLGVTGSDSVSITVVEPPDLLPPSVRIVNPETNSGFPGSATVLEADVSDSDSDENQLHYLWAIRCPYDSETGEVGPNTEVIADVVGPEGASPTWEDPAATLNELFDQGCDFSYQLKLEVTDPQGNTGSDFVALFVFDPE